MNDLEASPPNHYLLRRSAINFSVDLVQTNDHSRMRVFRQAQC